MARLKDVKGLGAIWKVHADNDWEKPWESEKEWEINADQDLMDALDQYADTAVTPTMAERIMDALCEDGRGDLLLLKDDEIREWWTEVLRKRKIHADRLAEIDRRARIREEALRKLSAEEREILGIK
jgi:hypothetical protein